MSAAVRESGSSRHEPEARRSSLTPISLRSELLAGGESDRSLARALKTGTVERPRRGAYVDGPLVAIHVTVSSSTPYAPELPTVRRADERLPQPHVRAAAARRTAAGACDLETPTSPARWEDRSARGRNSTTPRRSSSDDIISALGLQVSSPLRATLEVTTLGRSRRPRRCQSLPASRRLHAAQLRTGTTHSISSWPYSLKTTRASSSPIRGSSRWGRPDLYFLWSEHFPRPILSTRSDNGAA